MAGGADQFDYHEQHYLRFFDITGGISEDSIVYLTEINIVTMRCGRYCVLENAPAEVLCDECHHSVVAFKLGEDIVDDIYHLHVLQP